MKIQFTKYHANGNDFILVLKKTFPKKFCRPDIISRLCHRRFGIGADGMFIISPSKDSDFFLDYYNADGSWETLCVNGSRCVAQFIYKKNLASANMVFSAGDGKHCAKIKKDVIISLGGGVITSIPKEVMSWLPEVDFGFIGESYVTFPEVLDMIDSKKKDWHKIDGIKTIIPDFYLKKYHQTYLNYDENN